MFTSNEIEVTSEILSHKIFFFIPIYPECYPANIYVGRVFIGFSNGAKKVWSNPIFMYNSLNSLDSNIKEGKLQKHIFSKIEFGYELFDGCSFDDSSGYFKIIIPAGVKTNSYIGYTISSKNIHRESIYYCSMSIKRSKNSPIKEPALTTLNGTAVKSTEYIKTIEYQDYSIDYYYVTVSNIIFTEISGKQWFGIQNFSNTTEEDCWYSIDVVIESGLGVYSNEVSKLTNEVSKLTNDVSKLTNDVPRLTNDVSNIKQVIDVNKVNIEAYKYSNIREYFRGKYVLYN